jgi:hypothetical protein
MRLLRGILVGGVVGAVLLAGRGLTAPTQAPAPARLVWPNAESRANSDDWIRLRHNEIKQMKPRVLVFNFVNGLTTSEAQQRVNAVIAAIREASRYQGYKRQEAEPFVDYQVAKLVDMTDETPLPESDRKEGNSSLYPRVKDWKGGNNFVYAELFSDEFARHIKIPNPDKPSENFTLEQLVSRGMVHEVWFLALQGAFGSPHECTEFKQAYDANLRKIAGRSIQAGTATAEDVPFIGRSLRILHINPERGAGCALEKLGRALETTARSNALPYFTRYFNEFSGLELKQHYRVPFNDWGGRQPNTELAYPTPDTVTYQYKGEQFGVRNYVAPPGSVRFPPNARRDFDIDNMTPVLTNIEHYRLRDGSDGRDKAEPYTSAKLARYRQVAPDCVGAWMVYWRQSMPGLDNKALDDQKLPMKNWWPFLFY